MWWAASSVAILAAAATLAVAGCGSDDDSSTGTAASGGGGSASGKKITLVTGVKGDEFYITMACGAQKEADKLGVQLDVQSPDEFDPSKQTPIVNAVAAAKPDALLIAPTDQSALYAPIKQIADAGSKIVLVDTTLENDDVAVSQIATDNFAGRQGGGESARRADRRQRQGAAARLQSRRLDRRPARPGLQRGRRGAGPRAGRHRVQRQQAGEGGLDHQGGAGARPRPEGRLRDQLVRLRGRGDRPARGRRAGQGQNRRLRRRPGPGRPARDRTSCRR